MAFEKPGQAGIAETGGASQIGPREAWTRARKRIEEVNDPVIFISRKSDEELERRVRELESLGPIGRPLYGTSFVVKDNIDVAGVPTTAGCPAYAYVPDQSARVVELLEEAGALLVGKTNLDQFATGLVGTRSPYGIPRNPKAPGFIPGGSSSGSACAVSTGIVDFSLGTDTAGSGRIPAAFQGIVGLKPSRGMVSARGVVPACKSLDCVSIFARTVSEARAVLSVLAAHDPGDPYSRQFATPEAHATPLGIAAPLRIAVPRQSDLFFSGDKGYETSWKETLAAWKKQGHRPVEVDFSLFREAAGLLYNGPWVAERLFATAELLERDPDAIWPVTRQIIERARGIDAKSVFEGLYRLEVLKQRAREFFAGFDLLLTPTAPTLPLLTDVEKEPFAVNTALGYYTNFVNLLDLCGIAIPGVPCADGRPFGVTLLAPAGRDRTILDFLSGRIDGADGEGARPGDSAAAHSSAANPGSGRGGTLRPDSSEPRFPIFVLGAHMSGLPLNKDLVSRQAEFEGVARTRAGYRLYAFEDGPLKKPGLLRVSDGETGVSVEGELWLLPASQWGGFLDTVRRPLGLGRVELSDGRLVHGFLMESAHMRNCTDISGYGGWRAWLGAEKH